MSETPTSSTAPWWVQPRIVLPLLALVVLATAVLAPVTANDDDPRLSSYGTGANGAEVLYQLADRLGWQVSRSRDRMYQADPAVIHAVLAPTVPLRMGETRALLAHVRAGGGLLLVFNGNTDALADSLGVGARTLPGSVLAVDDGTCAAPERMSVARLTAIPQILGVRWKRRPLEPTVTLLQVDEGRRRRGEPALRSAVEGIPVGRGRVVVAADPDLLRNDQVRICAQGFAFAAVRALEYLRDGGPVPRANVRFDEYHQGYGVRAGTVTAIADFFSDTRPGHLLLQAGAAGLLLLLAVAPRLLPPVETSRLERRSALEHVDALARAYEQVGATRTAASHLVRGLRRRTERRVTRGASAADDDRYLQRIGDRHPTLASEVALLRRALATALPRAEFPAIGAAVRRIESTMAAEARR